MEIRDVGSNSYKSREGKPVKSEDDTKRTPRTERVANGVKVNKSKTSALAEIFFPDGINADDIWDYLLKERIAPGIMSGLRSFLDDFLDAIFGPTSRRDRDSIYRRGDKHVPYSSLYRASDRYDRDDDRDRDRKEKWRRKPYAYSEVAFRSRAEAEEVLDALDDTLRAYHICTVADFYEAAGVDPDPTDYLYGWTSIKTARVEKIAGGNFTVILPKASPID